MAEHNIIGKYGEEIARDYLKRKGYKIIAQNYKTKRGEVDIIATHKKVLVFIEVRTKQHEWFGTPEDSIGTQKIRKLTWNARAYVARMRHEGFYRLDAVCVIIRNDGFQLVRHYENITMN